MAHRYSGQRKPNFLYIGSSRAGSTWIYKALHEHPEVFVPPAKDTMYFERFLDRGFDWYLSFFKGAKEEKAVGEISHNYFLKEQYAEAIHEMLPNVKLLCSLREPLDKTISMYSYNRNASSFISKDSQDSLTAKNTEDLSFEDFVNIPYTDKLVDYYGNLKPFYDRFGAERILVVFYEDLKRDPERFARRIYSFLGVDESFSPSVVSQVINPAQKARSKTFAKLVFSVSSFIKRNGFPTIVGKLKTNQFVRSLIYKMNDREEPEVSNKLRQELYARYSSRYPELESMIGQKLPDSWYWGESSKQDQSLRSSIPPSPHHEWG